MSTHPLREGCFAVLRPPGEWPPAWDASVGLSRQALEAWFTCAPDDIVVVRMMHDGDAGNYAFIESLTITEGGIVSTECLRVVVPVEDRHDRAGGRGGPAAFARWYIRQEEERVALRLERDRLQRELAVECFDAAAAPTGWRPDGRTWIGPGVYLVNLHGSGWTAYVDTDGLRIPSRSTRLSGSWATALRAMEDPELLDVIARVSGG